MRDAFDEDEMDIAVAPRVLEDAKSICSFELAERIAANVNSIRVWREYRGMIASSLATKSSVAQFYLSDIETVMVVNLNIWN